MLYLKQQRGKVAKVNNYKFERDDIMKYDYLKNVREDVLNYIKENYEKEDFANLDYDELYDEMWIADSVTGNGSGSYTFNTWEAEENICHNMDLLVDALEEFDYLTIDGLNEVIRKIKSNGAEWCDVTIRCYLLGSCLQDVLEELKGEE